MAIEPRYIFCPCGGNAYDPEHVISSQHYNYTVRVAQREAQFQEAIIVTAKVLGWDVYHTHDSRRSEPGFPDLVLVKDRVLFREVKRENGRLTAEQTRWLAILKAAGADADVWRPRDWPRIERELGHSG